MSELTRKLVKSLVLNLISAIGAWAVAYSQSAELVPSLLVGLGTFGAFLVNIVNQFDRVEK